MGVDQIETSVNGGQKVQRSIGVGIILFALMCATLPMSLGLKIFSSLPLEIYLRWNQINILISLVMIAISTAIIYGGLGLGIYFGFIITRLAKKGIIGKKHRWFYGVIGCIIGLISLSVGMSGLQKIHEISWYVQHVSKIKNLGEAMKEYSVKHEGRLPASDGWKNKLVSECNMPSFILFYPFAMNGRLSNMKNAEIAGYTVLLFESNRESWEDSEKSLSGGPERLPKEGHNIVLLANGEIRLVTADEGRKLRWEP